MVSQNAFAHFERLETVLPTEFYELLNEDGRQDVTAILSDIAETITSEFASPTGRQAMSKVVVDDKSAAVIHSAVRLSPMISTRKE